MSAPSKAGSMILPDFRSAKQPIDVNESHGAIGMGAGVGGTGAGASVPVVKA